MRRLRALLAMGAAALLLTTIPVAAPPASADTTFRIQRDVVYNDRGLKLDVYQPEGAAGRPIVIFVHGGDWMEGSKYHVMPYAVGFARNNVIAIAPDFRMLPTYRFPAAFNDLRDVVGWTKANAAGLGGDPDKIVIAGVSSGATMAALVGLHDSVEVRAIIANAAIYDFNAVSHPVTRAALDRYMGPTDWRFGSPINLVSPDDPPVFLQHGVWDFIALPSQAEQMAAALRRNGVPCLHKTYLAGHELLTGRSDAFPTALADMLRFTLVITA